jgi:hypothetical protein
LPLLQRLALVVTLCSHGTRSPPCKPQRSPALPSLSRAITLPIQDLTTRLQQFVRQNYPQGLKWNPAGVTIAEAQRQVASGGGAPPAAAPVPAAAPRSGPPPGPPPPPPKEVLLAERPGAAPAAGGRAAGGGSAMSDVFKQLSSVGLRWEGTAGLVGPGCTARAQT